MLGLQLHSYTLCQCRFYFRVIRLYSERAKREIKHCRAWDNDSGYSINLSDALLCGTLFEEGIIINMYQLNYITISVMETIVESPSAIVSRCDSHECLFWYIRRRKYLWFTELSASPRIYLKAARSVKEEFSGVYAAYRENGSGQTGFLGRMTYRILCQQNFRPHFCPAALCAPRRIGDANAP